MPADNEATAARNERVVRAFLAGWDNRDLKACMAQVTDDMVYLNHPHEKIKGKKAVARMIGSIFAPAKKVEFILLNVVARGNKVVTERLDQWDWDGKGLNCKLPVCGIFELTDEGKIYEWREYYDNQVWLDQGGPSLVPQAD
jgi:limonene-1,2-epoxide hydrolase